MHFLNRSFQFPFPLSRAILNGVGIKSDAPQFEVSRYGESLKRLWPMLAQKRGVNAEGEKHYSFDAKAVSSYFLYYLTSNCMKVPLILEEMKSFGVALDGAMLGEGASSIKWLDFGAGPGTCFWGLAWWAAHQKNGFASHLEYTGIDQSKNFVQMAKEGASALTQELGLRNFSNFEVSKEAKFSAHVERIRPDVVSFMNSVGECFVDLKKRESEICKIIDLLKGFSARDQKVRRMIIIEPGSQAASRELLHLREALRVREGVRILLPCFDERPCGALVSKSDWCHEEAQCEFPEWFEILGEKAGLRKESLLFSYLVIEVSGQKSNESIESMAEQPWSKGMLRMVSQRFQEKGLTSCYLCTPTGKVKARVLNSQVTEANSGFQEFVRGEVLKSVVMDEKGSVEKFEKWPMYEMDSTVFPKLR